MAHAHSGHTDIPMDEASLWQHLWHGLPVVFGLVAFALLEITLGSHIHNPVVVADGGHNLTDAAAVGLGLVLVFFLYLAPLNRLKRIKQLETLLAIVICLSTIGLVGWLALQQILHQPNHPRHLLEATLIGLASFGLNRVLAWWLQRLSNSLLCSIGTHLYGDSLISLGIVVASGLTALVASPRWNVMAAFVVLGFVINECYHVIADAAYR